MNGDVFVTGYKSYVGRTSISRIPIIGSPIEHAYLVLNSTVNEHNITLWSKQLVMMMARYRLLLINNK